MNSIVTNDVIEKIIEGDENAFRIFYNQYYNKVYSIALYILKIESAAEDVVHDVFIKIWLNKERLPDIENLISYLTVLTKNHVFNQLRKIAYKETYIEHIIDISSNSDSDTLNTVLYKELHDNISQIVSELPQQQKRAYHLSRVEGLKHKEIAKTMKISQETVKKHISSALQTIKSKLITSKMLSFFI